MLNVMLLNALPLIYFASSLAYCCRLFFRVEKIGRAATAITAAGLTIHTAAYVLRWLESYRLGIGHSPFSFFTLYETIVFACWSLTIMYLVLERVFRTRMLGALVLPIISLAMLYAGISPALSSRIEALPTVLQGNVLAYHVTTCIMSLVAFLIACLAAMLLLTGGRQGKTLPVLRTFVNQLPPGRVLDDLCYKGMAAGFILFSMAMATGAYRARIIWGRYWSWDPVETVCLMVWLLYALILHGRYQRWWSSKTSSILSIAAFCIALCSFCIAGSYLMVSVHYPIR